MIYTAPGLLGSTPESANSHLFAQISITAAVVALVWPGGN